MKKTFAAFVAVATIAGSLVSVAPAAKAEHGQIAAGVAGGLIGGALLGGAIAASRPAPVYVAPAPVYVEEARPAAGSVSATGMVTAGVSAASKSATDLTDRRGSCVLI